MPWALGLWLAVQPTGGKPDYHDRKHKVLEMLADWKKHATDPASNGEDDGQQFLVERILAIRRPTKRFPYASVYGSLEQALRQMMVLRAPVGMLTTGHLFIFFGLALGAGAAVRCLRGWPQQLARELQQRHGVRGLAARAVGRHCYAGRAGSHGQSCQQRKEAVRLPTLAHVP